MIWVIIPTYNEERALPLTLTSIFRQDGNYRVVVVDGGSPDRTIDLIKAYAHITLLQAPKGRASQMNAGAKYAWEHQLKPTDWLLFLHADTQLPSEAFHQLHQLQSDHTCQAGGFQHQFSGKDWRLRIISWLDNFRCQRSQIIYGDQALFVRQGLFEQLGGFPNRQILEDVAFGQQLLAHTRPRILAPPVVTDPRKFIQMGVGRSFIRVLLIILYVEYGLPTLTPSFFQDVR